MAATNSGADKTSATILSGPKHNHLGTDTEGDHHYWNRAADVVMVVTDDGDRTQRYTVDDVSNWVDYVDDRRGWGDLRFIDLTGFALGEAMI